MSDFEPFVWCLIGVVAPGIFLKAYPREKLFNSIIVRSVVRIVRSVARIVGCVAPNLIATVIAIAGFEFIVKGNELPLYAILLGAFVVLSIPRMRGGKKLANIILSHLVNSYSHSRLIPQA
jgi:hypothetical protein